MKDIRKAIKENKFEEFRKDYSKTTSTWAKVLNLSASSFVPATPAP
jgi:hypothetical protein